MPKNKAKDGDDKKKIVFTFRVPPFLVDAFNRRFKQMEVPPTYQAYIAKLVEKDLIESKCITSEEITEAKDKEDSDE